MKAHKIPFVFLLLITSVFKLTALEDLEQQDERAIHAISSLRCHIQQLQDKEGSTEEIAFETSDIHDLWEQAQHPKYNSLLQQAKYYYERLSLDEAQDHLDYVWDRLLGYPNFDKNPFITKSMKKEIAPYLLPQSHPMRPVMDEIFSTTRVTSTVDSLREAGFKLLYIKDSSFIIVAKHPKLKDYLVKLYPDSEIRTRLNKPSWRWLLNRCIGAERIRKLIKRKKIEHFSVPDKWLYPLPLIPANGTQHLFVCLVTDMKLVSRDETKVAWQTVVTKDHLDELYTILSHGFGSNFLSSNVPYSKSGKFTFIDTEYTHRNINLSKVKLYIDPSLHPYWDDLVRKGKQK